MFRAAYRSSSGALDYLQPLVYILMWWPAVVQAGSEQFQPSLDNGRSHMGIQTRGCKYSLELLMMSGMTLEICWAFNKFWNNKFYYKVWLLLVVSTDSYYDARIHEY
jgi:hypothetical protein